MQAETGRHLKRIHKKRIQDLCSADARRWGDGIVGYDRVTFVDEQELAAQDAGSRASMEDNGVTGPVIRRERLP